VWLCTILKGERSWYPSNILFTALAPAFNTFNIISIVSFRQYYTQGIMMDAIGMAAEFNDGVEGLSEYC
jgi:hypothetical protein